MTLHEIEEQITSDPRNVDYTARGIPPIFQINPEARILIIGQAPGRKVEESRIPFNDKSGEYLMARMGIDRETFYSSMIAIVPMDFYYPEKGETGDLPPRRFVAEEYHPEIMQMMPEIRMAILIGKYSIDYYLKDRAKKNLTETVRSYKEYLSEYFPIVHLNPLNFRWQAKNPWFEDDVVPVLKKYVHELLL